MIPLRCWLLFSVLAGSVAASESRRDAFDWAFAFASAISTNDIVDQAAAQEKVLRDLIAAGDLERVRQLAPVIPNWRQGVVWAELAGALVGRGRTNEAGLALQKAYEIRQSYRGGWESDRIGAHMAMAYAAHGEWGINLAIGAGLPVEESVKTHTAHARQLVRTGQFPEARKILETLAASVEFDVLTVLLDGYLDILRSPGLTNAVDRQWILTGTRAVLMKLPLLRRMEVMDRVAREFVAIGERDVALALLEPYQSALRWAADSARYRAPAWARLAGVWRELGQSERSAECLKMAREVALSGNPMDRPTACAEVAVILAGLGECHAADAIWAGGLEVASGFVNARPRAMALADLCRSLGRRGLAVTPQLEQKFTELLAGLSDPW